jgi:hypothetical protein
MTLLIAADLLLDELDAFQDSPVTDELENTQETRSCMFGSAHPV